MRKTFLLTVAFSMVATFGLAQSHEKQTEKSRLVNQKSLLTKNVLSDAVQSDAKITPRRSVANGVYYNRPEGIYYNGTNADGSGMAVTYLYVPAGYSLTFTNMIANPANSKWAGGQNRTTDWTSYADEDGNLALSIGYNVGYGFRTPKLTKAVNHYFLGESGSKNADYAGCYADTIQAHAFIDANSAQSYGFGALSSHWLYGSGSITFKDDDTEWKSYGIAQFYAQPASPLYVEYFNIVGYSHTKALDGDAKLTMKIYNVEQDEDGDNVIGSKVLAELEATVADTTLFFQEKDVKLNDGTKVGDVNGYGLVFSHKEIDPVLQSETIVPFTLNEPFVVVITGFDQSGVDLGLLGSEEVAEDHLVSNTIPLITDGERNSSFSYNGDVSVELNFYGGFDYIETLATAYTYNQTTGEQTGEYPNSNVLKVSDDGKTITNVGLSEMNSGIDYVLVYTAYPWVDENLGAENYALLPRTEDDWVSVKDAIDIYDDDVDIEGYRTGQVAVFFECDALPAGKTGRFAIVNAEGKGYTSEAPIILLQGDATLEEALDAITGIESVRTSNRQYTGKTYNLAGQQVNKDAKGIMIQDGKKYFNK